MPKKVILELSPLEAEVLDTMVTDRLSRDIQMLYQNDPIRIEAAYKAGIKLSKAVGVHQPRCTCGDVLRSMGMHSPKCPLSPKRS